jgi:3-deoxy-D-manno-octulosonic-acid transferase
MLRDRLGGLEGWESEGDEGLAPVWVHAASVGELLAVRPLLERLRAVFPGRRFVVSTLTRTGLEVARSWPEIDGSFLFPLDARGPVRRIVHRLGPVAFLFTETEIWPTCLAELSGVGVPAFMVSGRVSARTAARRRWLRALYGPALAHVDCCMQTEEDARRIVALGADPGRVQVAGSLKFEGAATAPPPDVCRVRSALGLGTRRLIVAGSTHEGEDELVLDAFGRVLERHPACLLLLAPRHPERLPAVAQLVRASGRPLLRYSALAAASGAAPEVGAGTVVLLDMVGPLAHCYGLGEVAFVGGSLVPVGGHNVLEPARLARPVVVGPHTEHVGEIVERLVRGGGALRVGSGAELGEAIGGLLADEVRARDMGRRARALAESGQGAIARHVKTITARLAREDHMREGHAP